MASASSTNKIINDNSQSIIELKQWSRCILKHNVESKTLFMAANPQSIIELKEAVESLYFEAQCRIEDPVYGCVKVFDRFGYLNVREEEINLLASIRGCGLNPFKSFRI
ncbi:hypothetical protein CCACVL1_07582 [Corchorus capsularis]|uniref:LOB domain-containing protein n=1 Tax=Corchorus capsularis TaxID=210143 RepID=A0A1R3J4X1_COCAP|nr:hypothetical protein CCACVL1_07582 [Corchorus capsularis]